MPFYELLCLAKPSLQRSSLVRMIAELGKTVMQEGGIVTSVSSYGEQHLAYDLRKPFQKFDKASSAMIAAANID